MLRRKQLIVVLLIGLTAGAMLLLMASTMNTSERPSGGPSRKYSKSQGSGRAGSGPYYSGPGRLRAQNKENNFATDNMSVSSGAIDLTSPTDATTEATSSEQITSQSPTEMPTVGEGTQEGEDGSEEEASEEDKPSELPTVGGEEEQGEEGNNEVEEEEEGQEKDTNGAGAENEEGAETGNEGAKSEAKEEELPERSEPETPMDNDTEEKPAENLGDSGDNDSGDLLTSSAKLTSSPVPVTTENKSQDFTESA